MSPQDEIRISGLFRSDGSLERPVDSDKWAVPAAVDLDGDNLRWNAAGKYKWLAAGKGMLEGFCSLADAPASKIRAYAARWGVLQICEHGLPCSHDDCLPLGYPSAWEPIEVWRELSRQAFALLQAGNLLSAGKPAGGDVWAVIFSRNPAAIGALSGKLWDTGKATVTEQRIYLALCLQEWLDLAHIKPSISWDSRSYPVLKQSAGGLFGALALQLSLSVGRFHGFALCSACNRQYQPYRKPNPNRRQFCDECRDAGIPQQFALQDFRSKQRSHGKKTRTR